MHVEINWVKNIKVLKSVAAKAVTAAMVPLPLTENGLEV